jgi:glucose/arabinose dehydrogenase
MGAKFDGRQLVDGKDIFVADTAWSKSVSDFGGRMLFDSNGSLLVGIGDRLENDRAQNPADYGGKILRLRDDGTPDPKNPFIGHPNYKPEIYSLGHRNPEGLALDPSGLLWETEHGPLGGDELNLVRAGRNYGWPLATFGTNYDGTPVTQATSAPGLESPIAYWVPSIATSGLVFYTGNKFPGWKGNALVGGLSMGRSRGAGMLQRVVINTRQHAIQREPLLVDLHQRIRGVYQGADELIYVLTEEEDGAILKIEPAPAR